ncbi:protein BCP1 [Kwoniella heveanensis CBS 569]|nr:protein BCP1 [Kwoniella heveanensis CBS 569]
MPSNKNTTDRKLEAVPAAAASSNNKRKNVTRDDEDDSASDSGSDVSMINVDFDFYNLNPDVDQIAIKRLLRQTLSHDDELIDVHPLADLILSEGVRLGAGSSIKTDGEESDPWGLVAVVDIAQNRDNSAFKPFLTYLNSSLPSISPLKMLLDPSSSPAHASRPALIFSLRMLNLPLPLVPHLYRILLSELDTTVDAGGAKRDVPSFTDWIIWGRGYRLEGNEEGMGLDLHEVEGGSKKSKKKGGNAALPLAAGTFPYHPEEEFLDRVATHVHTYPFKTAPKRDEESFGVEQFGRLSLFTRAKLAKAVEDMQAACQ